MLYSEYVMWVTCTQMAAPTSKALHFLPLLQLLIILPIAHFSSHSRNGKPSVHNPCITVTFFQLWPRHLSPSLSQQHFETWNKMVRWVSYKSKEQVEFQSTRWTLAGGLNAYWSNKILGSDTNPNSEADIIIRVSQHKSTSATNYTGNSLLGTCTVMQRLWAWFIFARAVLSFSRSLILKYSRKEIELTIFVSQHHGHVQIW